MQASVNRKRSECYEQGFLTLQAAGRPCAVPLDAVIEVLRPLPIDALTDVPAYLLGLSVLRGQPVAVLDLPRLLGQPGEAIGRWLHLRVGPRRLALAVPSVGRVEHLDQLDWQPLPALFEGDAARVVQQVAQRDQQLYVQLNVMRLLPDSLWRRLEKGASAE
ncbi:chemotaxis protein CheW [Pseudomarimonas arenosa]|uniref:Chemotaxis protein CheW n=1 Tax=Pseudomarimonas arenosa TaxID=2774145 RepID=A0AAW3ZKW2_9GAMM|nr:chemotaxis protein CheW [Pseudomarimonas arenosa]MBD8526773.1 chemotaxis protein CheW [Pseudomarimonas arenosa]